MIKFSVLITLFTFFHTSTFSQTQAEMNMEANASYKKADAELNKVYKELVKLLDEKEIELLKKAQLSWIKYRDTHYEFEASFYEGGSIQPMILDNCLESVTETRIEELKSSISDREM